NLMTEMSGAQSLEAFMSDFQIAVESPEVRAVLLDIDSPGGAVTGLADAADIIFAARGEKPIAAFASGHFASGAYWLGSAGGEVVVSQTAVVGSVGVVAAHSIQERPGAQGYRTYEIVSSHAPDK